MIRSLVCCALFGLVLASAGSAVAVAEDVEVSQKGKQFAPAEVTVKAGDKVVFKNDDDVTHNAFTKAPGNEFEIRTQPPGMSQAIRMKAPGTVDVRCAIHPTMKLQVNVLP